MHLSVPGSFRSVLVNPGWCRPHSQPSRDRCSLPCTTERCVGDTLISEVRSRREDVSGCRCRGDYKGVVSCGSCSGLLHQMVSGFPPKQRLSRDKARSLVFIDQCVASLSFFISHSSFLGTDGAISLDILQPSQHMIVRCHRCHSGGLKPFTQHHGAGVLAAPLWASADLCGSLPCLKSDASHQL